MKPKRERERGEGGGEVVSNELKRIWFSSC
jgi:hypothetical protein